MALCLWSFSTRAEVPENVFAGQLYELLDHDPRILSERNNMSVLESRIEGARSGFKPRASINVEEGKRQININSADDVRGGVDTRALTITQSLFSGFGTLADTRAAKARYAAGEAKLTLVEQQVVLEFINAWTDISASWTILQLNERNVKAIEKFLKSTKIRYKAQEATITDMAQSESRLALAEANYAAALAAFHKSGENYRRLTHVDAPENVVMPPIPVALPATLEEVDQTSMDAPAVLQAIQEEKAAVHDIDSSTSSLWPEVSLKGSASETQAIPTLSGYRHLDDKSLTLNIHIPLYQGGAEYARIHEAKASRAKAYEETRNASLETSQNARRAWHDYQSSQEVAAAAERAAAAARRALNGVEMEYKDGARTLLDILDAQSEMINAEIRHTQAQADIRKNGYALLATTGHLKAQAVSTEPTEHAQKDM